MECRIGREGCRGKRQLAKRHGAPLELSCANVCIITFQFKLLYLPLGLCASRAEQGEEAQGEEGEGKTILEGRG